MFTCVGCCPPLLSSEPMPGQKEAFEHVQIVSGRSIRGSVGVVWVDDPNALDCDGDAFRGADGVCYYGKTDDYRALDRPIDGQWQVWVSVAPGVTRVSETYLAHELLHVAYRTRVHLPGVFYGEGCEVSRVNKSLRDMGF